MGARGRCRQARLCVASSTPDPATRSVPSSTPSSSTSATTISPTTSTSSTTAWTPPPASGTPSLEAVVDLGSSKRLRSYDDFLATALTDIESFWEAQYPALYDTALTPLAQGIYAAYPSRREAIPGCGTRQTTYADVQGNAFYCDQGDFIVYDDERLLPELASSRGPATIGIVFAHEFGHAIQSRAATNGRNQRRRLSVRQDRCLPRRCTRRPRRMSAVRRLIGCDRDCPPRWIRRSLWPTSEPAHEDHDPRVPQGATGDAASGSTRRIATTLDLSTSSRGGWVGRGASLASTFDAVDIEARPRQVSDREIRESALRLSCCGRRQQ